MNKTFLFLILFFLLTVPTLKVQAVSETELEKQTNQIEAKQLDKRAEILAAYLAKHDSPLQYHAQDFIDAAKKYNLDWKLVPAIAGVESTFGKQIPGGFNGWGWGVYGTQAIYFNSWTEAISTISKGLRENYIDKGYTEPYSMNKIYAASPFWGSKVNYFMEEIEKFATQFGGEIKELSISSNQQIAAVSASLASRSEPVVR